MHSFKRRTGIALTDYTLSLILVGLAIVPAIPFIAQAIQTAVVRMTATQATNAGMLQLKPLGALSGKIQSTSSSANQPADQPQSGTSTLSLTLSNGQTITIHQYPDNPTNLIETVGVNGYTTLLSDAIKQLAQQLLAKGVITSDQANRLLDLANQGYAIAAVEQQLENAAAAFNGSPADFAGSDNNQDVALRIKGDSIDVGLDRPLYTDYSTLANYVSGGSNVTSSFIATYNQILQSGSLNDPALGNLVGSLVYQVARTADATANVVLGQTATVVGMNQLKTYVASSATNTNSADICSAGNGNSNGPHCSP